ncbi:hypothetical protein Hanom_Chr09g00844421 [Helianthus anomalus]
MKSTLNYLSYKSLSQLEFYCISQIVDYIKSVAFILDTSEDEAGKVLLALLHQDIKASKFAKTEELKAFKFAASRLHITSPLAVVIEKRSIRKLLSKICDTDGDPVKENLELFVISCEKIRESNQTTTNRKC